MAIVTLQHDADADAVDVRAAGEIDYASRPDLDRVISAVAELGGSVQIDVDLRAVTFLDAVGVAFLLRLHKLAVRDGHELAVSGARPQVLKVLRITGTSVVLGIDSPMVPAQPRRSQEQGMRDAVAPPSVTYPRAR